MLMIEYDLKKIIGLLRKTIVSITSLPDDHVFYVGNKDIPDYPYVTMEITQPHVTDQTGNTKQREVFHTVINLNCYGDNALDASTMADDISTKLYDPIYIDSFHDAGTTIANIAVNGASNDTLFGDDTIYTQNLQLTLRFNRQYISNINHINDSNI